jgi:signal peptidase II
MRRWIPVAATFAAVLVLDQASKALVRHDVRVGEENAVFPAVQIVHVKNTGVAFGLGSGTGWLVVVLTLVALTALVVFFARSRSRPGLWLPTGLLLGGAVGNLLDRARIGSVTDFIKLPAWPAFNVADIAITVGVLALLYVLEGPRARED